MGDPILYALAHAAPRGRAAGVALVRTLADRPDTLTTLVTETEGLHPEAYRTAFQLGDERVRVALASDARRLPSDTVAEIIGDERRIRVLAPLAQRNDLPDRLRQHLIDRAHVAIDVHLVQRDGATADDYAGMHQRLRDAWLAGRKSKPKPYDCLQALRNSADRRGLLRQLPVEQVIDMFIWFDTAEELDIVLARISDELDRDAEQAAAPQLRRRVAELVSGRPLQVGVGELSPDVLRRIRDHLAASGEQPVTVAKLDTVLFDGPNPADELAGLHGAPLASRSIELLEHDAPPVRAAAARAIWTHPDSTVALLYDAASVLAADHLDGQEILDHLAEQVDDDRLRVWFEIQLKVDDKAERVTAHLRDTTHADRLLQVVSEVIRDERLPGADRVRLAYEHECSDLLPLTLMRRSQFLDRPYQRVAYSRRFFAQVEELLGDDDARWERFMALLSDFDGTPAELATVATSLSEIR